MVYSRNAQQNSAKLKREIARQQWMERVLGFMLLSSLFVSFYLIRAISLKSAWPDGNEQNLQRKATFKNNVPNNKQRTGVSPATPPSNPLPEKKPPSNPLPEKKPPSNPLPEKKKVSPDEPSNEVKHANLKQTISKNDETRYHMIFSTDCSDYQHWQSYLLFYNAFKVGQPGRVTRIASGCSEKEAKLAKKWHKKHIKKIISDMYDIHFTPDFSNVAKSSKDHNYKDGYEFFNKPFGLLHWLEHGKHIGSGEGGKRQIDEDVVVILLDPDMTLLRPITDDFTNEADHLIKTKRKKIERRVKHGSPFAQRYGFGTDWQKRNVGRIAGSDSPALRVSAKRAGKFYPAGPPYVATARDMHKIALKWTEFVPKVFDEYPQLLAEMYAYSIAAAHLELPHQLVESLMISMNDAEDEGWPLIDNIPATKTCSIASHIRDYSGPLPKVLHYCQRYMVGDWFFTKPSFPRNFFTCETPLLVVPPMDVAVRFNYRKPPPPHPIPGEKKPSTPTQVARNTFALCSMISKLNELGEFFKDNHCNGIEGTRRDKSLDLWKLGDYLGQNFEPSKHEEMLSVKKESELMEDTNIVKNK